MQNNDYQPEERKNFNDGLPEGFVIENEPDPYMEDVFGEE